MLGRSGQVSIEILLLTTVILMMSIAVFSYYTQIRDSTNAMELLKVETLRLIDKKQQQFIMQEIKHKIAGNTVHFCISTEPVDTDFIMMETALKNKLAEHNAFLGYTLAVHYNQNLNSCD